MVLLFFFHSICLCFYKGFSFNKELGSFACLKTIPIKVKGLEIGGSGMWP